MKINPDETATFLIAAIYIFWASAIFLFIIAVYDLGREAMKDFKLPVKISIQLERR